MYKHDHRRLLQFAHQRFEQTGLEQWKHGEKWKDYCDVCKANELLSSMEIMNKINPPALETIVENLPWS